jgi:hypothetical protein
MTYEGSGQFFTRGVCKFCGVTLENPRGFSCDSCKKESRKRSYDKQNSKRTQEDYKANNATRTSADLRRYNLKSKYGLDFDPINSESVCEICGSGSNLNIDHNHDTGKFRGILCGSCNTFAGRLEKNLPLLDKFLNYIEVQK